MKLKKNDLSDADMIPLSDTHDEQSLPEYLRYQFEKINEINCYEFVDDVIDKESPAYLFKRSLDEFRYQYKPYLIL